MDKGKDLTVLIRENLKPKFNYDPDLKCYETILIIQSSFPRYTFFLLSLFLCNSMSERSSMPIFFQMLNRAVVRLNGKFKMQKLTQHSTVCSSLKQLYQFWILMRTAIWLRARVAIICIMHCIIKKTLINWSLTMQSKIWWGHEITVPKQTSICTIYILAVLYIKGHSLLAWSVLSPCQFLSVSEGLIRPKQTYSKDYMNTYISSTSLTHVTCAGPTNRFFFSTIKSGTAKQVE